MMANFDYFMFPDPFLNVTVGGSPGQIKNVLSIKQVYTKVRTPRKQDLKKQDFYFPQLFRQSSKEGHVYIITFSKPDKHSGGWGRRGLNLPLPVTSTPAFRSFYSRSPPLSVVVPLLLVPFPLQNITKCCEIFLNFSRFPPPLDTRLPPLFSALLPSCLTQHSEPLFKELQILKLGDLVSLHNAPFVYQCNKNLPPSSFDNFLQSVSSIHQYKTTLASRSTYYINSLNSKLWQIQHSLRCCKRLERFG